MDRDVQAVRSNGAMSWLKSTFSGDGNCCVEVNLDAGEILVRDSKFGRQSSNSLHAQPVLAYTPDEWRGVHRRRQSRPVRSAIQPAFTFLRGSTHPAIPEFFVPTASPVHTADLGS